MILKVFQIKLTPSRARKYMPLPISVRSTLDLEGEMLTGYIDRGATWGFM